jgi:DNA-binding Lrp family transcriptional regulator
MKLSEQERTIVAACEMEGDLTIPEIARRAGVVEHIARRTLSKFKEAGVVKRRAYVNSFLLGTPPYLLTITLTPGGQQNRKQLHAYLLRRPEVGFVSLVGGHYTIFCEVRAASMYQLQGFLDGLSHQFGNIFSNKQVLALTSMNDFPVFATLEERQRYKEFETKLGKTSVSPDALDMKILTLLGQEWEDSLSALARRIGQPVSTIDYHLKKMREVGLLLGARYFVDLFALQRHFFYHLVSIKGFHPETRGAMLEFAREETCCNTFRSFIGPWNILFECHYESANHGLEFVERLLARHAADISGVETVPVLAHDKGSDCTVFVGE